MFTMTVTNPMPASQPPAAAGRSDAARPVDLAHLARQTMGSRELEQEVLHLFLRQSETMLARLSQPGADQVQIAHVLVGSARGIGAHMVAETAARVEARARAGQPADPSEIGALEAAVQAANGYIRGLAFAG